MYTAVADSGLEARFVPLVLILFLLRIAFLPVFVVVILELGEGKDSVLVAVRIGKSLQVGFNPALIF